MVGQSDTLVKAVLRRQGVNPPKVKKKPKPFFSGGGGNTKITPKDVTVFSRQLTIMMSSEVPLVQAFEIVWRGHENAGMLVSSRPSSANLPPIWKKLKR